MSEVKVWCAFTHNLRQQDCILNGQIELVLKSDYDKLQADLKKAVDALQFYANEMNYSVDDYYGISGEMRKRCVLYKDCEERNDVYSYAGKLARSVLKELRGEK